MRLLKPSKPYLLLLPCLLFFIIFTLYGTVMVFVQSLDSPANPGSWCFLNYDRLFRSTEFISATGLTLTVGVASTVMSLIFGTVLVHHTWKYFNSTKWTAPVWLPMLIPHFAAGYIMVLILGQSGWLSGLVYQLNLISDQTQFPVLVNDRYGIGIIATYIWKEVPFVVLMLIPVYQMIDWRYADVVRTLGGGKWELFKTVEWPLLYPVLAETGVILFAFIISAFEVPYLLGVTYPKMLPVMAFRLFYEGDWSSRPLAMAVMTISTTVILVIALITVLILQTRRYRMMRGR